MTTFEMKAIRFRSDEGVRNGVLVGEGPKWLKLVLPDCRGIRVTEVPTTDRQFVTDIDVPIRSALNTLKVHAARVGCLQSAADVLGIKAIEPPRDSDPNGPTLGDLRQEMETMARAIPKTKKATDKKPRRTLAQVKAARKDASEKKPRVKVERKAKGDDSVTPATRARNAAVAHILKEKLTVDDMAKPDIARAVKDAMIKGAPDATLETIGKQFWNVKAHWARYVEDEQNRERAFDANHAA